MHVWLCSPENGYRTPRRKRHPGRVRKGKESRPSWMGWGGESRGGMWEKESECRLWKWSEDL